MRNDFTDPPSVESEAPPAAELRRSINQFARDVITLCELQAELLQVDVKEWVTRCMIPAMMLSAAAVIVGLASAPLLLLSLAYALVEFADFSLAAATLTAGVIGLAIAAVCGMAAWRIVRREHSAFHRFNVELSRNLRWLKQVVSRPAGESSRAGA